MLVQKINDCRKFIFQGALTMIIVKRDGRKVEYDSNKIVLAISSANKDVKGKDKLSRSGIEEIIKEVESKHIYYIEINILL